MKYLSKDRDVYQFCISVPKALQSHYAPAYRIRKSLHTTDLKLAEKRCREWTTHFDKEFDALKLKLNKPDFKSPPASSELITNNPTTAAQIELTPELATAIIANRHRNILGSDDQFRHIVTGYQLPPENRFVAATIHKRSLATLKQDVANYDVSRLTDVTLNHYLRPFGASIERLSCTPEELFKLKLELLRAERDATNELIARDAGDGRDTDVASPVVHPPKKPGPEESLSIIHDLWASEEPRDPRTSDGFKATLKQFSLFVENKPLKKVLREDVNKWVTKLEGDGYANKTITSKIKMLTAMFNVAILHNVITVAPSAKVKTSGRGVPKKKIRPFTVPELNLLFQRPWLAKQIPTSSEAFKHWIPAIGLATGARIREICQLQLSDFYVEDGINVMVLTEYEEDSTGKLIKKRNTKLKNSTSKRRFPIHPDLIAMGLVSYVETERKKRPEIGAMLFPDLDANNKYNDPSQLVSKWWARYSSACGVTDIHTVFHSFRHTLIDSAKAIYPDPGKDVRYALTGHKEPGASGIAESDEGSMYGGDFHPLAPLVALVGQIKLPIDITKLMK